MLSCCVTNTDILVKRIFFLACWQVTMYNVYVFMLALVYVYVCLFLFYRKWNGLEQTGL